MESIGERLVWHYVPFTDIPIPLRGLNIVTVLNSVLVMILLLTALRLAVRKFAWIPGRAQVLVEVLIGAFDSLVSSSLELETREKNRHYLPLIASLFIYIILCNAIPLLPLPHIEEPTSDLNCTLGLGVMSVSYSFYCGMRTRGVRGQLTEMCGPLWPHKGKFTLAALPGKFSALLFFPLHIVEDISRIISISFRLFGNITGAAIVLTVVSALTYGLVVPLGLDGFLLVFEAAIQAFVFSMLTLMYIASAMQHEEAH
jgi:F-type H+-transporting ATPase subunit a